jgi:hypothetical protein
MGCRMTVDSSLRLCRRAFSKDEVFIGEVSSTCDDDAGYKLREQVPYREDIGEYVHDGGVEREIGENDGEVARELRADVLHRAILEGPEFLHRERDSDRDYERYNRCRKIM